MRKHCGTLGLLAAAVATTLAANPASAARSSFAISTSNLTTIGGGTNEYGVWLGISGLSGFYFDFILPADYKPGSTVKIFMNLMTPASGCAALVVPDGVRRGRRGEVAVADAAGLIGADGTYAADFGDPFVVLRKAYRLKPTGAFPGQKPGDYIAVLMRRDADGVGDTCAADVAVWGITVDYKNAT
jgi:hypothetical protein